MGPLRSLYVRLLEANPLAFERLRSTLQEDAGLCLLDHAAVLADRDSSREVASVFVIDAGSLPHSLSKSVRSIRMQFPQARIVVLDHPQQEEDLLGLLFLGVHGFVPYGEVGKSLAAAIRQVGEGRLWFAPEVLEKYVRWTQRVSRLSGNSADPLTPGERRVAELLHRRLANKEIAALLGISENTVKFHLKNVYLKLDVHDRYSAVDAIDNVLMERTKLRGGTE